MIHAAHTLAQNRDTVPATGLTLVLYLAFFAVILSTVLGYLFAEYHRHRANLRAIPIRIHVNGIRGKSSITRLINGALSTTMRSVAKTTGTAARYIDADGDETAIVRRDQVNVIEQVGVVARAAAEGAHALVVECMAVDPMWQRLCQDRLVQGQVGVISNVRWDHVEEMGPTLADIARALSGTMPGRGGTVFTAETDPNLLAVFQREANRHRCHLVRVDIGAITDADMTGFDWITFPENVALALAVADHYGIDHDTAIKGMQAARPDPGVLRVDKHLIGKTTVHAVNLFAANDPDSTIANFRLLTERGAIRGPVDLVINCRPDRAERNAQQGAIAGLFDPANIYLIGAPTRSAAATVPDEWQARITDLGGEKRTGEQIRAHITTRMTGPDRTVVMVGNIHGRGEQLLSALDMDSGIATISEGTPR